MNKLQALLIAGLLSLSSASFATSISYTSDYIDVGIGDAVYGTGYGAVLNGDQAGTITLDNDGVRQRFEGELASVANNPDGTASTAQTSAWWEVIINADDLVTFGWADNTLDPSDLTVQFFDGMTALSPAFLGDFSVSLGAGTYKMLLTGTQGRHYDGDISAVPVPAAGILFASALLGAGAFGRRKKKSLNASMVGAFTRAS